jgi:hypothetical protein
MEPIAILPFTNPATGERFGEVPMATPAEVQAAVDDLRAAAVAWGRQPIAERVRVLRQLQAVLVDARDEISEVIVRIVTFGRKLQRISDSHVVPDGIALVMAKTGQGRMLDHDIRGRLGARKAGCQQHEQQQECFHGGTTGRSRARMTYRSGPPRRRYLSSRRRARTRAM